jgi:hypothetical protein
MYTFLMYLLLLFLLFFFYLHYSHFNICNVKMKNHMGIINDNEKLYGVVVRVPDSRPRGPRFESPNTADFPRLGKGV